MKNNQIISIWGSPSSGKTITSIKIARELSRQKKNVVIVLCDIIAPALLTVLPQVDIKDQSLGKVLSAPEITQQIILSNCLSIPKCEYLSIIGYRQEENVFSYAEYSKERVVDFFILLRHLADYVIIDCQSSITTDLLSTVALEIADIVLRIGTCNFKGISYFDSQLPLLVDRRFNADKHIKIISNYNENDPIEQVIDKYGGIHFQLPHVHEIEEQISKGELFEELKSSNRIIYHEVIRDIVKVITGGLDESDKKKHNPKKSPSKRLFKNRKEVKLVEKHR